MPGIPMTATRISPTYDASWCGYFLLSASIGSQGNGIELKHWTLPSPRGQWTLLPFSILCFFTLPWPAQPLMGVGVRPARPLPSIVAVNPIPRELGSKCDFTLFNGKLNFVQGNYGLAILAQNFLLWRKVCLTWIPSPWISRSVRQSCVGWWKGHWT